MDLQEIKALGIGLLVIVVLGVLVMYFIEIVAEIPEWLRSRKFSKIAKKYNLQFIRAKKGWKKGWLGLRAGERNILNGSIGGFPISLSELTLIEGNFILGDDPSIAIQGSEWDMNRVGGSANSFSQKTTRLNGKIYYRLSLKTLQNIFDRISHKEITTDDQLEKALAGKDFSKHVIFNFQIASLATAFSFAALILIESTVFPVVFANNENIFASVSILFCIISFFFFGWRFGKKFSSAEITKYPGQDKIEARLQYLRKNQK